MAKHSWRTSLSGQNADRQRCRFSASETYMYGKIDLSECDRKRYGYSARETCVYGKLDPSECKDVGNRSRGGGGGGFIDCQQGMTEELAEVLE